jgi:hypothetical protein
MRNKMLLISFLLLGLSGCAQPRVVSGDQTIDEQNDSQHPLSKNCEDAKYKLDKTVSEGQLSDLKELKRNIELYCIWRRD